MRRTQQTAEQGVSLAAPCLGIVGTDAGEILQRAPDAVAQHGLGQTDKLLVTFGAIKGNAFL